MALRRPFDLPSRAGNSRGSRSVQRILEAAARLFGRDGYEAASMHSVANAAGVSKGLLHYHFQSKEHLLIEAVRATFRQIHQRFMDRAGRGDGGMSTAVDVLDALWSAIYEMRSWTPFMVETTAQAIGDRPLREHVEAFYAEATDLLEDGIAQVFARDLDHLAVPPARLARMVRINLQGLIIELAWARSPEELAHVEQAYRDLRDLFARVVVSDAPSPGQEVEP